MTQQSTTDRRFLASIKEWVAKDEISALIRFSGSAGSKSFEFFSTFQAFETRIATLPTQTSIIVFKDRQLPIRGLVDSHFINSVLSKIPDAKEYLIAGLTLEQHGLVNWYAWRSTEGLVELEADLNDLFGKKVAVGIYPPWQFDNDSVVSAIVPQADGTVVVGVY